MNNLQFNYLLYIICSCFITINLSAQNNEPFKHWQWSYNIMPNPANNVAIVRYNITENAQQADLIIYDIIGKLVKTYNIDLEDNPEIRINTTEFKRGIYFISLRVNGENKVNKKLVVSY